MKLLVRKMIHLQKTQQQPPIKFFDTSALLAGYKLQKEDWNFISNTVFQELEHIKTSQNKDDAIKYKARSLVRYLMKHRELWSYQSKFAPRQIEKLLSKSHNLAENNDGLLICEARLLAKYYHCDSGLPEDCNRYPFFYFITSDASQYFLAASYPELHAIYYTETAPKEDLWKGYKEIWWDDEDEQTMAYYYEHPEENTLELQPNEYALIYVNGELSDLVKWDGKRNDVIKYKEQNSDFFGKIKPRNDQQKLFFDLLQNRDVPVKLARGQYGSGKTFLALIHAWNLVKWHKFDKIVYVRNNVEVYGSQKLGALPGEQEDKLMPFLMPLADILGDVEALRQAIEQGFIEPEHLGFIRGRSFNHSIIFVDEAENLTTDNVKLILGRVGEGSEVWFLGDESQTDSDLFRKNSGIASLISSLKGDPAFGTVELQKSERSSVAQLAAKIREAS